MHLTIENAWLVEKESFKKLIYMPKVIRGYSSVVEHSTADRDVTGSNPVVPLGWSIG